ncbi:RIMS-binding protein 2-like isoform X2 [Amphiprion ocellaris]|uniref:RIMS-binding protein 2-like isoform X2 n=1 Tax=Amphiprion ocellaris TaxID=80972 RepID=UPI00164A0C73|nr:RIMS-binding protein 2-like isoform X2 [Amphiprion ocellaris]
METRLELDVLIYPDEVRVATPEDVRDWELETASQVSIPTVRLFVALYPYNPAAMSPNPETAAEELPFVPGQIIKVFGDTDADGFYHGMSLMPSLSDVASIPDDVVVRRMVALFDYDPWESSPNMDSEVELGFRSGDIIYVLGNMDQDGFYYGDLHGRRGLVPSNFLQPLPWE